MNAPLHVIALGLASPLGLDRRSTQLELDAGTDVFEESELLDARERPIRACRLATLPARASRGERMLELGVLALCEIIDVALALGLTRLPLVLALPEPDQAAHYRLAPLLEGLLAHARAQGLSLVPCTAHAAIPEGVRRSGCAGVFELLTLAAALLDAGHDPLLLGAIDSRCDPTSLLELARAGRVLDLGPEGYIPSEGAGFVLLARDLAKLPTRLAPPAIVAVAHDVEPRPFAQLEPSAALGLTRALRSVRIGPPALARVDHALSCQWDATYWGRELVQAYLRNAELFPEPLRVDAISTSLGNPGAAAALLQLGRALALARARADASQQLARALVYGCSEAGPLGALVVEARPGATLLEGPLVPPSALALHFERERLRDHLERIGSLLVERHDDHVVARYPWPELAAIEQRLDSHVLAARDRAGRMPGVLEQLLDESDPELDIDIVRAATHLLARIGAPEQHARVCEQLEGLDAAELALARTSLVLALQGQQAEPLVAHLLAHERVELRRLALELCDALEQRPVEWVLALLAQPELDDALRCAALWLLARSGDARARPVIEDAWLREPERAEWIELMLALGRHDVLDHLRLAHQQGRALPSSIDEVWALAAGPRDAEHFARLATLPLDEGRIWALSSHGGIEAIPPLLDALDDATLAPFAALALERMLGAGLITSTWIPDADAELPEREGETRLLPTLDASRWRSAWAQLAPRFAKGARIRLGRPLDAVARIDELALEHALPDMRSRALRELAASLGTPLYFGFDWSITTQQRALARLRAWLEAR